MALPWSDGAMTTIGREAAGGRVASERESGPGRQKAASQRAVARQREALIGLSHRIHANPELAFREEKAASWAAELLADAGFSVTKPAYELSTAFVARTGDGPLHVAIFAEYDALPAIGHACGHNIIAASA